MARQFQCTTTGEPVQPARVYFRVRDQGRVLASLRRLRCVQPDPARDRWVWLYEHEAAPLSFVVPHDQLPARVRPLVIAELLLPSAGRLFLHALSFDRAIHAVRFLAPRFGRAAVPVRVRVLNRLVAGTEPRAPAALDALLDRDVTVIDPARLTAELVEAVDAAGARGDPERVFAIMQSFDGMRDVPEVEDLPLHPEDERPDYRDFATTLQFRFIRAQRRWAGRSDTLADIIREVVASTSGGAQP